MSADFHSQVRCFYEANRQALFTYALSLARDRAVAEDAVQAAIFGLLRRGRLPANPRPYVFRSVRNAIVDGMRREPTLGVDPLLDATVASNGQPDPARVRLVEQCLGRLSDDERETLVLKVFDGLTFREIASVRRKTLGTVTAWYRRGVRKMRRMLEEEA
jgi:RNA polymerase sigma-70 factor (ECF subfamily)